MKRWISLLLIFALFAAMPQCAWAEDEPLLFGDVDPVVPPADWAGDTGLTVDYGEDEIDLYVAETPAPTEAPAPSPEAEVDAPFYAGVAAESAVVCADAELQVPLARVSLGDALLVTDDAQALKVAFDSERGIVEGYISAECAARLDDPSLEALLDALASREDVALYGGDPDYPLPRLDCVFLAGPEETPVPEGKLSPEEDPELSFIITEEKRQAGEQPTGIELSAKKVTIGVKEVYTGLSAKLIPEDSFGTVTWRSGNKKIVKVSSKTGKLTGVKAGTTYVYASVGNGIEEKCKVTVKKAPSKVTVEPDAVTLAAGGMTQKLKVSFPSKSFSGALSYKTSNEAVATVNASGVITAVGEGSATITVTAFNGKKAKCKVTVRPEPAIVAFDAAEVRLGEGQEQTLVVSARAADGSETLAGFTFAIDPQSDDPGCIRVDTASGAVTAVRRGSARVCATAHNGISASAPCAVRVIAAPADLTLSSTSVSVGKKEKFRGLTAEPVPPEGETECAGSITWRSSNKKIAKVNSTTGVITGVKSGTAYVYARTHNGIEKKCKVKVKKAPKSVTVSPSKVTLCEGGMTYKLKPALSKGSASALGYKSSNKDVAKVSSSGKITTGVPGSAKITVSTFNGKTATFKVKVLAAPVEVFLPDSITVASGLKKKVEATVAGPNGAASTAKYTFSAENGTGSVEIDAETGELTAGAPGTAFVRVTTHNGVSTHFSDGRTVETVCAVTVLDAPKKVQLAETALNLGVKEEFSLEPEFLSADGEKMSGVEYTVTSSRPKVVSVNGKGVVKALKGGTATITVKAYNGVKAKCQVAVLKAPSKITLSPKEVTIGVGQSAKLKVTYPKKSCGSCTYSSSDKSVVKVSSSGKITGVAVGKATITAKSYNGKTATTEVTVLRAPSYVTLNAEYELVYDKLTRTYVARYLKTLAVGKTFQLKYENEYMTAGVVESYESSDTSVAKVSSSGLITAKSAGTADITLRSTGGAETVCRVTVTGSPEPRIAFAEKEISVVAGRSVDMPGLTGTHISAAKLAQATYDSDNEKVAAVSWDEANAVWKIHGKAKGTATITAKADGAKAKLSVSVVNGTAEPTEISFGVDSICMAVAERYRPEVVDEYGEPVAAVLSTGNAGIVAVNDGALVAMAAGETDVTATVGSLTARLHVKVNPDYYIVGLDVDSLKLGVGQRRTLKATVDDGAADIAFASSNPSVATVSAGGVVIARKVGKATITASVYGGSSASCEVTVAPAPTGLSLNPADIDAYVSDGGQQLKWSFGASGEVGSVSFASSDKAVAKVDAKGYVTFKGKGRATITATTHNGLKATVDVLLLEKVPASSQTRYRLFAAYSFFDPDYAGYLPFTRNNAKSMAKVFENAKIDGKTYSTKVMGNPSKTALLSGISSFFADTTDNDISVVFLCSHGNMAGNYTDYRLSLPGYTTNKDSLPNYYVTSNEIFKCVKRIKGRVLLIIDSCYSGTFLEDMADKLDEQNGRISVLTAASNTSATYYKVADTSRSVDFFTFFLLQGIGYNEKEGWYNADAAGSQGTAPGYLAADRAGNNDGQVTIGEFYDFAAKCIAANIPSYSKKSWFWGNKNQKPRIYAGANADLVIYAPKQAS